MKKSVQKIQFAILPILKEKDVRRCGLFGSFALGQENKESDVDLIVDLPDDKSLFDLVDLQLTLEAALGRKVDIITYRAISPLLKDSILKEQIPLYEKGS